jgi:hypothetical protein
MKSPNAVKLVSEEYKKDKGYFMTGNFDPANPKNKLP